MASRTHVDAGRFERLQAFLLGEQPRKINERLFGQRQRIRVARPGPRHCIQERCRVFVVSPLRAI